MNYKKICLLLGFLCALSFGANAQSLAEFEAAKAMAKSYGYSDEEIDEIIDGRVANTTSTQGTAEIDEVTESSDIYVEQIFLEPTEPAKVNEEIAVSGIFGHNFFISKGFNIVPSYNAPAPDNYVLGPGDEVQVDIWGNMNSTITGTIARDGTVMIPGLGPIRLGRLTVKKAEIMLKNKLKIIYSDLGSETLMRLSLGRVKSIIVNVVGDVTVPGAYSLPAMAPVTSAIFFAGGVTETASVRDIKVYREGKLLGVFDLYDFIFDGAYNSNILLQDNDIISVSSYTGLVGVTGDVMRGMQYELKEGETLEKILRYAGGFTENADRSNVNVSRKSQTGGTTFDVKSDQYGSFVMNGGDLITVRNINFVYDNIATIGGEVIKAGPYAISSSMKTVRDLILAAGGLTDAAYRKAATIARLGPNREPMFLSVDLDRVLSGLEDINLEKDDVLTVLNAQSLLEKRTFTVYGEINKVGDYDYREGMTLGDVMAICGGLRLGADMSNIEIASHGGNDKGYVRQYNLITNPEDGKVPIKPLDNIFIRRQVFYRDPQTITINGEVRYPGTYVVEKSEVRLSDIFERCGGATAEGYIKGARLTRTLSATEQVRAGIALNIAREMAKNNPKDSANVFQLSNSYSIGIDLQKAIDNPGGEFDILLRSGDVIELPRYESTVKISGSVFYPNVVTFNPHYNIRDYLKQAGGMSQGAKRSKVYVVYMNGMVSMRGGKDFRMEPGMEIVVPKVTRPERKVSTAEVIGLAASTASISYMIAAMVRLL